jgi:hypothetical protein
VNPGSFWAQIGVFRTSGSGSSGNGVDARKENRFNRIFFENNPYNPFDFMQNSVRLRGGGSGIDLRYVAKPNFEDMEAGVSALTRIMTDKSS